MTCQPHDWVETGEKRKHIEGSIFKYGTPTVKYVKCSKCGKIGYKKFSSNVIYTWDLN